VLQPHHLDHRGRLLRPSPVAKNQADPFVLGPACDREEAHPNPLSCCQSCLCSRAMKRDLWGVGRGRYPDRRINKDWPDLAGPALASRICGIPYARHCSIVAVTATRLNITLVTTRVITSVLQCRDLWGRRAWALPRLSHKQRLARSCWASPHAPQPRWFAVPPHPWRNPIVALARVL